ncbi:hypothetical protein FRB94_005867 [Tulasnella sp. JGI-2019a]|nr:hypothetical protein FRB94_005867 [Tulasnella sp. JGI-2019a]KAG9007937.1 hypothetical protein FRB93_006956 [Tulasnella sp. JGI-2019a]KAG9023886.1 hypothetical protein FRB95_012378 [Tulasnella sp. JGI-2019a]
MARFGGIEQRLLPPDVQSPRSQERGMQQATSQPRIPSGVLNTQPSVVTPAQIQAAQALATSGYTPQPLALSSSETIPIAVAITVPVATPDDNMGSSMYNLESVDALTSQDGTNQENESNNAY